MVLIVCVLSLSESAFLFRIASNDVCPLSCESNLMLSLTQFLHYGVTKVHVLAPSFFGAFARRSVLTELFHYISRIPLCQAVFLAFFTFLRFASIPSALLRSKGKNWLPAGSFGASPSPLDDRCTRFPLGIAPQNPRRLHRCF